MCGEEDVCEGGGCVREEDVCEGGGSVHTREEGCMWREEVVCGEVCVCVNGGGGGGGGGGELDNYNSQ